MTALPRDEARDERLRRLVREGARLDGLDHCLLRGDGFELAVTEAEAAWIAGIAEPPSRRRPLSGAV